MNKPYLPRAPGSQLFPVGVLYLLHAFTLSRLVVLLADYTTSVYPASSVVEIRNLIAIKCDQTSKKYSRLEAEAANRKALEQLGLVGLKKQKTSRK